MRTDCWLPLTNKVGGRFLVRMSSQALYREPLVDNLENKKGEGPSHVNHGTRVVALLYCVTKLLKGI